MLGQVLGRGLLGQAGAVQEFTLQQGQVCLWEDTGWAWGQGARVHSLALMPGTVASGEGEERTMMTVPGLRPWKQAPGHPLCGEGN